jgi:hypothetical protein
MHLLRRIRDETDGRAARKRKKHMQGMCFFRSASAQQRRRDISA